MIENSGMRHRAHGAIVAGEVGILGVHVGSLECTDENDQADAQEGEDSQQRVTAPWLPCPCQKGSSIFSEYLRIYHS